MCDGCGCGRFIVFFWPQCHGGFKLLWVWLCVRSYRVFWNLWLQIALEWLHDVAWVMFWGGSRSTKPCVFPCKVAAGDDERYLVCATVAAAVGLSFFFCRSVTVASSCFGCGCVCVVIGCFGICGCRSHWNGCMMLHGLCFGEEAGARKLVFFRVKWLQATMKGTSCVRRVRLGSFLSRIVPPMCFATSGCSCVRSSMRFLKLWWQIALEWLHDVAWALCWGGSRSTKPCVFPCKVAAAGDERYLVCAAVAAAVGLSFFFCRSVTVASSCFGCGCVCVVIGCFGICGCRSHWNGCMILHGLCFGEEAGARNLVFFRVKWLQATMKGTSCVRRLRLRSVYRFFLAAVSRWLQAALGVVVCVRSYRVFWNLWLQIALEWLHDVAWVMFWGGSRSTKPCVFPCKVAAGDDERYLVCATVAAAVGLSFFFCRSVTVASSCFGRGCVCIVIGCFGICGYRSHWNGCMMLHGLCFGEEAGARNLVFFRVKWLQATMKGTSCVRRLRLRSVYRFFFAAL